MTLQIATWNIFFGNDLSSIFSALRTHKDFRHLDMFAIQEASTHAGIEDARKIAAVLGKTYAYYQVTSHTDKGRIQANAFVWNTKSVSIVKKSVIDLPTAADVALGPNEKILKSLLPSGKRKSLVLEGIFANRSFRIYVTHFDVVGFIHKNEQLACILRDDKKREPVDFSCILGDLNTFSFFKRPNWLSLKKIALTYGYLDITTHISWTFHLQAIRFRQKLDAILLKDALHIRHTSWSSYIPGSDHIPLFAKIEVE